MGLGKIEITFDEHGNVKVNATVTSKMIIYGVLELAKEAIAKASTSGNGAEEKTSNIVIPKFPLPKERHQ